MNIRAVPFIIAIANFALLSSANEVFEASVDAPVEKRRTGRRTKLRADRKERKEAMNKAPKKRFDVGNAPGSVHRTYQHMSYQELEEGKQKHIADRAYDVAIDYGKQQMAVYTDAEAQFVPDVLLEMADLLYAKKDYDKAWKAYAHWALQYPGATKKIVVEAENAQRAIALEFAQAMESIADLVTCTQIEHARYRATDAAFRCTQDIDRDQTQTQVTIELADEFLKQQKLFITHHAAINTIRTACYEKLIASELGICSFYRLQGNTKVVEARLALIEEEYATPFPESKNLVVAYRTAHYPETILANDASRATLVTQHTEAPKTHAADRF